MYFFTLLICFNVKYYAIFVPEHRTNETMNKPTKKRNILNKDVVDKLIEDYGVSRRFITMSIRGDRTSTTSDKIVKDYKRLENQVKEAVKAAVNQ